MSLSAKQRGVLKGMLTGIFSALLIIVLSSLINPFSISEDLSDFKRLQLAIKSALVPGLFLALSIGRMARQRFFSPEDIDGGGLSTGSDNSRIMQSLLQNTLEQSVLAFIAYLAWSLVMPSAWISTVPVAACFFGLGRILFFVGYKSGAPARALGFTLSFYPSVLMLFSTVLMIVWQLTAR